VPQGSVLGLLLFIIYINDLPHIIQQFAKPVIYADDTTILIQATNITELHVKVNDAIHHIKEWFLVNALTLYFGKTNIIKFSSKKEKKNIIISAI